MFNNEYENYMRSVLGYPITNDISTYNLYNNSSNQSFDYNDSSMYGSSNSYFPYRSPLNSPFNYLKIFFI